VKSARDLLDCLKVLDTLAGREEGRHFQNIKVVDLNFGCPSRDVISEGAGPALLKRRSKLREILATAGDWRKNGGGNNLKIEAFGAKIRLGLNKREKEKKVYMDVVEIAKDHMDYLTVHCRHAAERSRDAADWQCLAEIKTQCSNSKLKIIGNGDAITSEAAQKMLKDTLVDGVMIARGAISNPFSFSSSTPTLEQLAKLEKDYFHTAAKFRTKSKYIHFHTSNFQRIRDKLLGGTEQNIHPFPKNNHLT
jgi:tRNA-dihydrouridine synthase